MNYRYRVTLSGIKGFYRVYVVNGDNSLYTFHKQLRADLEFPMDQPILFKALDAEGGVVARYALMDIGYGAVDNVTVADTIKAGALSVLPLAISSKSFSSSSIGYSPWKSQPMGRSSAWATVFVVMSSAFTASLYELSIRDSCLTFPIPTLNAISVILLSLRIISRALVMTDTRSV